MTQDISFLDSNLIRAFPFVPNQASNVPDWLLTDFKALILVDGYDPAEHTVYLAWVALYGETLRLGFRSDCEALADEELVFEFNIHNPRYTTVFASSTPLLASVESMCGCDTELLCNPGFEEPPYEQCGPELLCNPDLVTICAPSIICDLATTTAAP